MVKASKTSAGGVRRAAGDKRWEARKERQDVGGCCLLLERGVYDDKRQQEM